MRSNCSKAVLAALAFGALALAGCGGSADRTVTKTVVEHAATSPARKSSTTNTAPPSGSQPKRSVPNADLTAGVHRSSSYGSQCVENLNTGRQFCGQGAADYCQAIASDAGGGLPRACQAFFDRALVSDPTTVFERTRNKISRSYSQKGKDACAHQDDYMKSYLQYTCDAYTDLSSCVDATKNYRQIGKCRTLGVRLGRWASCSANQLRSIDFSGDCGQRPDVDALESSFGP